MSGIGPADRHEAAKATADRFMLPPTLGWGQRTSQGIPARQVIDPISDEEMKPPPQP